MGVERSSVPSCCRGRGVAVAVAPNRSRMVELRVGASKIPCHSGRVAVTGSIRCSDAADWIVSFTGEEGVAGSAPGSPVMARTSTVLTTKGCGGLSRMISGVMVGCCCPEVCCEPPGAAWAGGEATPATLTVSSLVVWPAAFDAASTNRSVAARQTSLRSCPDTAAPLRVTCVALYVIQLSTVQAPGAREVSIASNMTSGAAGPWPRAVCVPSEVQI